ncbi:hypothetical protein TL5118_03568 [Thalassovita autumnalis]|uniref:Uncharacterized protein n=1 Tax=Thalassovita autumnalis TaxID=2072972 RepID=A0A0P1GAX1_9RHOB|nr:hypothetical protein [Thalassovita autumnalis]CUH69599.1 hypothetical protein TL5118_03568 [Thalassovita autumnalis]CUH73002.1 hypothetical protein TL5120_02808 [Thalassovita autumnalis]
MVSRYIYGRMVRLICAMDLVILAPLIVPVVNQHYLVALAGFGVPQGVADGFAVSNLSLMLAQLVGLLGCGWALWRWRNATQEMGRFTGALRLAIALVLLTSYLNTALPVLQLLALLEGLVALVHFVPLRRHIVVID